MQLDSSRSRRQEKMKLVCSYNGRFQECSPSGKLRYVDGETRIMSLERNIGLSELVSKVKELHCCTTSRRNDNLSSFSLIYRHGEEDSPLVPVTCDNDVNCMIDEYYRRLETLSKDPRLCIFVSYNDKNRDCAAIDCNSQLVGRYHPMRLGYGTDVHGGIRSLKFTMNDTEILRALPDHCWSHRGPVMKMGNLKFSRPRGSHVMGRSNGVRLNLGVSKRGYTVMPNHGSSRMGDKMKQVATWGSGLHNQCQGDLIENGHLENSQFEKQEQKESYQSSYHTLQDYCPSSVDLPLCNLSISSPQRSSLPVAADASEVDKSGGSTCFYSTHKMSEETDQIAKNWQQPEYNGIKKEDIKTNGGLPADLAAFYAYLATKELQVINNSDLEFITELGSGAFATVFYGKWKGSDVAIKKLRPDRLCDVATNKDFMVAEFWKEAHLLGQLRHPNIVTSYGVVTDGSARDIAGVMEYMVNGSLNQVLRRKDRTIDGQKRLIIAMDSAFGMEYLHTKNIIHFDLKSHNILVNMRDPIRPVCKISDLGLSKIKQPTLVSGGMRGTIRWMAPELLNNKEMVDEKVDVYSFGIVMWELLTGKEPYANMKSKEIIGGVIKGTLRPEIPSWCNPAWRSVMERCWASDPDARPSFSEIGKELRAMAASMNIK